ncbi:MAG: TatD family hydrolase [Paludibacteraceae bacterium]|jgi:TatD DNase family protein|nr:TatD family hydrolase [Paludibacteraceae bacterium]
MIDTHTHIYDEAFLPDAEAMVLRAKEAGITHAILPNVDASTVDAMRCFHAQFPDFTSMMIGIHPTSIQADYQAELDAFNAEISLRASDYIAIGEIGLDLYWDKTYLQEQKKVFEYQIDVAIQLQKPICIHCRDAFNEVVDSLKKFNPAQLNGVFHCFTGTPQMAEQIAKLGNFYYGIGGPATYKNAKFIDQILHIPLSRILLETDAPYLPPVPFRGKRNEPAYVPYVAQKLADIYGITVFEVDEQTTKNVKTLFFGGCNNNF